jgi:hypothetical protein
MEGNSRHGGPSAFARVRLMNNDALIAGLCSKVEPIPQSAATASLLRAVAIGAITVALIVVFWPSLGIRPDLGSAVLTSMFWVKVLYTASMAIFGFAPLERLSRPDSAPVRWAPLLWPPFGLMLIVITAHSSIAPETSDMGFWLGSSWWQCPLYVLGLSAPVGAVLMLALSRLAPTRLAVAGAAAGLLAGATGATAYAFHCVETSPGFVFIWYSLGLIATSAAGSLLGPRILRW